MPTNMDVTKSETLVTGACRRKFIEDILDSIEMVMPDDRRGDSWFEQAVRDHQAREVAMVLGLSLRASRHEHRHYRRLRCRPQTRRRAVRRHGGGGHGGGHGGDAPGDGESARPPRPCPAPNDGLVGIDPLFRRTGGPQGKGIAAKKFRKSPAICCSGRFAGNFRTFVPRGGCADRFTPDTVLERSGGWAYHPRVDSSQDRERTPSSRMRWRFSISWCRGMRGGVFQRR